MLMRVCKIQHLFMVILMVGGFHLSLRASQDSNSYWQKAAESAKDPQNAIPLLLFTVSYVYPVAREATYYLCDLGWLYGRLSQEERDAIFKERAQAEQDRKAYKAKRVELLKENIENLKAEREYYISLVAQAQAGHEAARAQIDQTKTIQEGLEIKIKNLGNKLVIGEQQKLEDTINHTRYLIENNNKLTPAQKKEKQEELAELVNQRMNDYLQALQRASASTR